MKRHVIFGLVVLTIISLWGSTWYFIPQWYNKETLEAGTFGDMFGAVNALFSGLAFAGLIYTITVQRQELALQREAIAMQTEELRMQREETARSADQLEGQKILLNLQMAMSVVNDLIQVKNRRLEEVEKSLPNERIEVSGPISKLLENHGYNGHFRIHEDELYLQSYLNTFFFTLNLIQSYDLQDDQKQTLFNLVNMNTTDDELQLIYAAVENQHRLGQLYNSGNFFSRHEKIIEAKSSSY
jgi:hypothetical protein